MFTWFKELFNLIGMLFTTKPSELKEVELKEMKYFPFKNAKYMMWCGYMVYRTSSRELIEKQMEKESFKTDKRHETLHLKQAQCKGSWVKYYSSYIWQWLKGNPLFNGNKAAYYTIPFEMEAYANEDNQQYLDNYDCNKISCYKIKDRIKEYKKFNSSYNWKQYIKTFKC